MKRFLAAALLAGLPLLAPSARADAPKPWDSAATHKNSLGMKFREVPGTPVLVSVWETRVSDYAAFVRATGRHWEKPDFAQTGTHPVVNVSWEDAMLFCRWLTDKEAQSGKLQPGEAYRLPTSAEWDAAVGLPSRPAASGPASAPVFPWGVSWPPPLQLENYGEKLGVDRFPQTAPVGSFAANAHGLHDLGGNVREWCLDSFSGSENLRVLRGASWRMNSAGDLRADAAVGNASDLRFPSYGFRCVLERGASSPAAAAPPVQPVDAAVAVQTDHARPQP